MIRRQVVELFKHTFEKHNSVNEGWTYGERVLISPNPDILRTSRVKSARPVHWKWNRRGVSRQCSSYYDADGDEFSVNDEYLPRRRGRSEAIV